MHSISPKGGHLRVGVLLVRSLALIIALRRHVTYTGGDALSLGIPGPELTMHFTGGELEGSNWGSSFLGADH